jgi:hypothetical protein
MRRYLPFLVALLAFPSVPAASQDTAPTVRSSADQVWTHVSHTPDVAVKKGPRAFHTYAASDALLTKALREAPYEISGQKGRLLSIPMPDGSFTRVRIQESPVLSPELQARHPEIRTYIAQGVDDPSINGRLDRTPAGFHATLFTPNGMMFVNPVKDDSPVSYRSYWRSDVVGVPLQCGTTATLASGLVTTAPMASIFQMAPMAPTAPVSRSSGDRLRTYQLAVNTTAEYTQYFGGTEAQALAAATSTINGVTGIYEREVAIRFQLVYLKAFTDPATEPFHDTDTLKMLVENQAELDRRVASGELLSYDVGMVLGAWGSGGQASLGVVCISNTKGQGAVSADVSESSSYDMSVAHELGHMFNANHTWSCKSSGGCPAWAFVPATAMEPGSGSTIMSYAGGMMPADEMVTSPPDPYFHSVSFDEIITFRDNSACGIWSNTGNHAPTVVPGSGCTVPRNTPLLLMGTASDPDAADAVTANWEQMDAAPAQVSGQPSPTATVGPLFRSQVPIPALGDQAYRLLPSFENLVMEIPPGRTFYTFEVLPAVDRLLHFRVTGRDNRAGGGGVSYSSRTVTVSGAPFQVTSPAPGTNLECGESATIAWDIGGSSAANVQMDVIGNDGFQLFALGNAPNTGSFTATLPGLTTQAAFLRLTPDQAGACYFAFSKRFAVVDTKPPLLTVPAAVKAECTSPNGTAVTLGTASASDTCDSNPSVTNNAPALFGLGVSQVVWTGSDHSGNCASGTQSATVVDTTPPQLTPRADIVAECSSPNGTPVNLGAPITSDICDASPLVTKDAPGVFPLGATTVHWLATDHSGNQTRASQTVTVRDTTPPTFTDLSTSPAILWPPNHNMVRVAVTATGSDSCSPSVTCKIVAIKSNEPVDDSQGDWVVTGNLTANLRADRLGSGNGRIYAVTVQCMDKAGNSTTKDTLVTVPHDQGK